ncbi:MAG: hypothetical protein ACYSTF_07040 [Planctomycetota bacterium]|jgi:hypothetical protein
MKKALFSVLIVLVLSWSCGTVLAKDKGKGKGGRPEKEATEKAKEKESSREAGDAKEVKKPGKDKRAQAKERVLKRIKKHEKEQGTKRKAGEGLKAGSDANRPTDKAARVKGRERQFEILQKKTAQEEAKHMRRQARLQRIRELAVAEGKTDIVARVDKLLQRENERYAKKQQILKRRESRLSQSKEGKRRMPTKTERDRRGKRRERRYKEGDIGKRGSRGKKREESTADSNNQ